MDLSEYFLDPQDSIRLQNHHPVCFSSKLAAKNAFLRNGRKHNVHDLHIQTAKNLFDVWKIDIDLKMV